MARIVRFFSTSANASRHPTEVECSYQVVHTEDGPLLQLSTYGSPARASEPKVSQTIQLDRDRALELQQIIGDLFG